MKRPAVHFTSGRCFGGLLHYGASQIPRGDCQVQFCRHHISVTRMMQEKPGDKITGGTKQDQQERQNDRRDNEKGCMRDQSDLERFVEAQRGEIDNVRAELIRGSKSGHWMWYVFPQLRGLGHSWMANYYGISSIQEAEAYLGHPILGTRLLECTELVNRLEGRSAEEIFGGIDAMKFRSSMTLFAESGNDRPEFAKALGKYFAGNPDPLTLGLLKGQRIG